MDLEELIEKLSDIKNSNGWTLLSERDIDNIKEVIYNWADRQKLLKEITKLKQQVSERDAKMRSEIEQERVGYPPSADYRKAIMKCLQIIDKYKLGLDAGRWIPVTERLPKDGKWALFTDGSNMSVERYKRDAIDHFFPQERWFSFDKAIAWMPLPEPYKPESEVAE